MFRFWNSHLVLLGLQVLTLPLVASVFRLIPERSVAGLVAGSWFVVLGLLVVFWRRTFLPFYFRWSFYLGLVHLIGLTLPILYLRLSHWGTPFEFLNLFGIAGPAWHKTSTSVFAALMACTFRDFIRGDLQLGRTRKKQVPRRPLSGPSAS